MVLIRRNSDSFDSEEEDGIADQTPIEVTWLNYIHNGELLGVGISTLPGCKIRDQKRSVIADLETLKDKGITDIFVFSTSSELVGCGVSKVLYECDDRGFSVHYYPFSDSDLPSMEKLLKILGELKSSAQSGKKVCLQSPNGIGKACMMAGLFGMYLNDRMTFDETRSLLFRVKGVSAIQTVKEYNYLSEFRSKLEEYQCSKGTGHHHHHHQQQLHPSSSTALNGGSH